jgi:hypothetical protein
VLSNFNTILEYEMSYYEQRAEYLKALSSLEELVAQSLEKPGMVAGLSEKEKQR